MLLLVFHLTNQVILYVKDEGSNLKTLASTLTSVVFLQASDFVAALPGSDTTQKHKHWNEEGVH